MPTIKQLYDSVIHDPDYIRKNELAIREIICHIQGYTEMTDFFVNSDAEIADLQLFQSFFARFLNGEPVQYILNNARFLDMNLYVDNRVLIPRMETEEVVKYAFEKIREYFFDSSLVIADIGTGSGAIALAMAKELPKARVVATDISNDALNVARHNAKKFNFDIEFFEGDALQPLYFNRIKANIIISNPPYITNVSEIDDSVIQFEPYQALVDKEELKIYKDILTMCPPISNKPCLLIFEIGHDMREKMSELIKKYVPNSIWEIKQDINGKDRMISIYIE
jgi:release factor glutamine methyltransferase